MLENGMVVDQEMYDPQCRPYVCSECGEMERYDEMECEYGNDYESENGQP